METGAHLPGDPGVPGEERADAGVPAAALPPTHAVLLDRELERGRIDRVIETARQGRSAALVLQGEPGMGKTTRFDGVRVPASDYHPVWLDSLADDVTLEGSAMNGVVQGAEAVRPIVIYIRTLYDSQEFNFAGTYGENGFLEDYTAQVRGEQIGNVVLVTRNAAGQAQHIVANYRPRNTLLLLSRLIGEHFAGTPYGEHFASSVLE
jgi:hypothetical protein